MTCKSGTVSFGHGLTKNNVNAAPPASSGTSGVRARAAVGTLSHTQSLISNFEPAEPGKREDRLGHAVDAVLPGGRVDQSADYWSSLEEREA